MPKLSPRFNFSCPRKLFEAYNADMIIIHIMAATVFYISIMGFFTFLVRKKSVQDKQTSLKYFKAFEPQYAPPEYIIRVGRHFDNLFQLPILFLVSCSILVFFNLNSFEALLAAWAFLASRLIHSYIHLGSNHVLYRFVFYATGLACIAFIWLIILLNL